MSAPTEYTITRCRGRFYVAVDGEFATPDFPTSADAWAWWKAHAAMTGQRSAGISEAFGRGREGVSAMHWPHR